MTVRQANPLPILLAVLGVLVMAGGLVALGFFESFGGFALVLLAGAAIEAARRSRDSTVRLRVDGRGITMPAGGRPSGKLTVVPWHAMREIVLTESTPPGAAPTPMTLAVRLAAGAPLPASVKGRISDPDDPDADDEQLTAKLGDLGIDAAELRAALARYGGDKPLVERRLESFRIGGA